MKIANLVPLTIGLAALAIAAPAPELSPALSGEIPVFPAPAGPMEIPTTFSGSPVTMQHVIESYGTITGQTFSVSDETSMFLRGTNLNLTEPLSVPIENVQTVFETLLIQNGFVLDVLYEGTPRLLTVISLNTGARTNIRQNASYVSSENVAGMRQHPAMLFMTVVDLPRCDVRQLANSMRTMITDANTQQLLPAGNTTSLVVTGMGAQVADLVEMLERINDTAPEPVQQVVKEPEGGK